MDPSGNDMADVLTANIRTMKEVTAQVDTLLGAFWALNLLVSLASAILIFYLLRKLVSGNME